MKNLLFLLAIAFCSCSDPMEEIRPDRQCEYPRYEPMDTVKINTTVDPICDDPSTGIINVADTE
jgi:hypothetical protein